MPPLELMDRNQDAVLWAANGVNRNGQVTVTSTPVEIKVRWVNGRREVVNAQGATVATDATVIVDRDIPIGSVLRLETLADWTGTGTFEDDNGLCEVIVFNKATDLKGRNVRREAMVMRRSDTLPTS